MYHEYPPFRYSVENKETALLIRNKRVVDFYTHEVSFEKIQQFLRNRKCILIDCERPMFGEWGWVIFLQANEEEKQLLNETEQEAQLTKKWILNINQQQELESKTLTQDFNSSELFLLHKIQSKFMSQFRQLMVNWDSSFRFWLHFWI